MCVRQPARGRRLDGVVQLPLLSLLPPLPFPITWAGKVQRGRCCLRHSGCPPPSDSAWWGHRHHHGAGSRLRSLDCQAVGPGGDKAFFSARRRVLRGVTVAPHNVSSLGRVAPRSGFSSACSRHGVFVHPLLSSAASLATWRLSTALPGRLDVPRGAAHPCILLLK